MMRHMRVGDRLLLAAACGLCVYNAVMLLLLLR